MLRICRLGDVQITCSPFVLAVIVFTLFCERFEALLVAFASLTLHEACHTILARRLGYAVASVEVQPFGFVARLARTVVSPGDECLIAAAGPVGSIVAGCCALSLQNMVLPQNEVLAFFASYNLSLAAMNLLPALPLDGGRVVRALLSRLIGVRASVHLLSFTGVLLGTAFLGLGVMLTLHGSLNLTVYGMGAFLLLAAIREWRCSDSSCVGSMLQRAETLRRGNYLKLYPLVMDCSATAEDALRALSFHRYTLIVVVNKSMHHRGMLDEGMLLDGIAAHGTGVSLEKLIDLQANHLF